MRSLRHLFGLAALSALGLGLGACGTDAMATDSCSKIEQARCRKAPACPALTVRPGTGVEECVQFSRDRCLHGLPVPDPGPAVVDKCVSAIEQSTSCESIQFPETLPACSFLQLTPTADGGLDAEDAPADVITTESEATTTETGAPDAEPADGG